MQSKHFKPLGGVYSETAAVQNVLAHSGLKAPHTGDPYNEAMLFGISGGVGFSYFTFEYKDHAPTLYLGMANRYKTRYGEYMDPLFEHLGIQARVQTSSSVRRAQATLLEDLSRGSPVILHVDRGRLPYMAMDRQDADHALVVHGFEEETETFQVADLPRTPLSLSAGDLSSARASFRPLKNRSTTLELPTEPVDLKACLQSSILACSERMLNPPKPVRNFGIAGMRKWADRVNHPTDSSGWLQVFSQPDLLFDACCGAFAWIETRETGGAGLRGMYAEFLEQAGDVLQDDDLWASAQAFSAIAQDWRSVADALLPDSIPELAQAKDLLRRREQRFLEAGAEAVEDMQEMDVQLHSLRGLAAAWFHARFALLDGVHEALLHLIAREEQAHIALQARYQSVS